jgi:X-X-X-Leu-X-X-Gly heptad repeat protein
VSKKLANAISAINKNAQAIADGLKALAEGIHIEEIGFGGAASGVTNLGIAVDNYAETGAPDESGDGLFEAIKIIF